MHCPLCFYMFPCCCVYIYFILWLLHFHPRCFRPTGWEASAHFRDESTNRVRVLLFKCNSTQTTPSLIHLDVYRSAGFSNGDDKTLLLGFCVMECVCVTRYAESQGNLVKWWIIPHDSVDMACLLVSRGCVPKGLRTQPQPTMQKAMWTECMKFSFCIHVCV